MAHGRADALRGAVGPCLALGRLPFLLEVYAREQRLLAAEHASKVLGAVTRLSRG